jgi:hypothetical protein
MRRRPSGRRNRAAPKANEWATGVSVANPSRLSKDKIARDTRYRVCEAPASRALSGPAEGSGQLREGELERDAALVREVPGTMAIPQGPICGSMARVCDLRPLPLPRRCL